jgi:type III secretory pathway component EscS
MNKTSVITNGVSRALPWNSPTTWVAVIAVVALFILGLRAVLDPNGAPTFFGLPVPDYNGLAFVQVYGARNMGMSLLVLALIFIDNRPSVAIAFIAATLIAGVDAGVVISHAGLGYAFKHIVYMIAFLLFGSWLFLRR